MRFNQEAVAAGVDRLRLTGLALAAGSGVLYGSINVLAKPVDAHPFAKAAIAYLVSCLVLSPGLRGLRIARGDWPKVLAMGLVGGGLAPVLLFFGLLEAAAADAGLLLTVEMVATAVLAMAFLGERYPGREVGGLALLLTASGCVALASQGGDGSGSTLRGMALVLGSALAWGIDNAVSARLVGSYRPMGLISLKGMLGGSAALLAALAMGVEAPAPKDALAMAGLGVLSVALSSMLFYTALRRVGAGRTSALNISTTALTGAAGGALLLDESLGWLHLVALLLVGGGAALLATHRAADGAGDAGPAAQAPGPG